MIDCTSIIDRLSQYGLPSRGLVFLREGLPGLKGPTLWLYSSNNQFSEVVIPSESWTLPASCLFVVLNGRACNDTSGYWLVGELREPLLVGMQTCCCLESQCMLPTW